MVLPRTKTRKRKTGTAADGDAPAPPTRPQPRTRMNRDQLALQQQLLAQQQGQHPMLQHQHAMRSPHMYYQVIYTMSGVNAETTPPAVYPVKGGVSLFLSLCSARVLGYSHTNR